MSPNNLIIHNLENRDEVISGLEANFTHKKLCAGESKSIKEFDNMAAATDFDQGVYQYLRAVVKAGESYFSVVDTRVYNKSGRNDPSEPEAYISTTVTRSVNGGPAELIASVQPGNVLFIGRENQPNMLRDDPKISRNHFCVRAIDHEDGSEIVVADMGSTNGTEVYSSLKDSSHIVDVNPDFWCIDPKYLQQTFFGQTQ